VIHYCEQRTPEWFALRAGKVTASRMGDVLAVIAKGEAAARRKYRAQVAVEILTGHPIPPKFLGREMEWRGEMEPHALVAYQIERDLPFVETVGFVTHDNISRFGGSPDVLVGDDGLAEFKVPDADTHMDYLLKGFLPEEYKPQMRAQLACMPERQWCDFVSYHPHFPAHLQLFVRRFYRDEPKIAEIETKVCQFLAEVDVVLEQLAQFGDEDLTPILKQSLELVRSQRGPQPIAEYVELIPEEWEAEF
jgi:hypothetical protein